MNEEKKVMSREVFMKHLSRVEWFCRTNGAGQKTLESLGSVVDFVQAIKKWEGDDEL